MFRSIQIATLTACALAMAGSSTAQSSYQVVPVNNAGTISGVVKWSGPQPAALTLPINKDAEICDPESHKRRDLQRLIIGPDGGVANTVVFLKDISGGKAMDIPEERRFLDQRRCQYEPHILIVPQNGTLQMKSSDAVLHTVHMDGAATFNLPFPFVNRVNSRVMPNVGLVNLKCNGGHVWMNAEILVVPHPYYTVTDESGSFTLTGVPPGQYVLVAWHEGWSVLRQEGTFDVLTERKVDRPLFSDPRTWEKKVTVSENGAAVVNFTIPGK
jgi:hypothetical protein